MVSLLDFDFVESAIVGNQHNFAIFCDISLQNQTLIVLCYKFTLQNQGLTYTQDLTSGSPTSSLQNQALRSKQKFP